MRLRLLLILSAFFLLPVAPARAELVVVVSSRSPVTVLMRNEVMNIFFGRNRQFASGLEAQPVDLQDTHPDRAHFYRLLVAKDLPEINAYWSRLVFSGRVSPPPQMASSDDVIKWVIQHPGGIGFVDSSRLDARLKVVLELSP